MFQQSSNQQNPLSELINFNFEKTFSRWNDQLLSRIGEDVKYIPFKIFNYHHQIKIHGEPLYHDLYILKLPDDDKDSSPTKEELINHRFEVFFNETIDIINNIKKNLQEINSLNHRIISFFSNEKISKIQIGDFYGRIITIYYFIKNQIEKVLKLYLEIIYFKNISKNDFIHVENDHRNDFAFAFDNDVKIFKNHHYYFEKFLSQENFIIFFELFFFLSDLFSLVLEKFRYTNYRFRYLMNFDRNLNDDRQKKKLTDELFNLKNPANFNFFYQSFLELSEHWILNSKSSFEPMSKKEFENLYSTIKEKSIEIDAFMEKQIIDYLERKHRMGDQYIQDPIFWNCNYQMPYFFMQKFVNSLRKNFRRQTMIDQMMIFFQKMIYECQKEREGKSYCLHLSTMMADFQSNMEIIQNGGTQEILTAISLIDECLIMFMPHVKFFFNRCDRANLTKTKRLFFLDHTIISAIPEMITFYDTQIVKFPNFARSLIKSNPKVDETGYVTIKFLFIGFHDKKQKEFCVDIPVDIFLSTWIFVPIINDMFTTLFEMTNNGKETDSDLIQSMVQDLNPIVVNLTNPAEEHFFKLTRSSIEGYVHLLENDDYSSEKITMLTIAVAESLGDFQRMRLLINNFNPLIYTKREDFESMTPIMIETLFMWYCKGIFENQFDVFISSFNAIHAFDIIETIKIDEKWKLDFDQNGGPSRIIYSHFSSLDANFPSSGIVNSLARRLALFVAVNPEFAAFVWEEKKYQNIFFKILEKEITIRKKANFAGARESFDSLIRYIQRQAKDDFDNLRKKKTPLEIAIICDTSIQNLQKKLAEMKKNRGGIDQFDWDQIIAYNKELDDINNLIKKRKEHLERMVRQQQNQKNKKPRKPTCSSSETVFAAKALAAAASSSSKNRKK